VTLTLRDAVAVGVLEVVQVPVGNPDNGVTTPMLKTPEVSGQPRVRLWHDPRHLRPWRWALESWADDGAPGQQHGGARTWWEALRASVLVRSGAG